MAYSATQLQLTHVLQKIYRKVGKVVDVTETGTTTTLKDTKLADDLGESNEDDLFNGGTVIIIEDAGGANAAPEGEFSRITDYEASSTTVTFSPALTTAPATGDKAVVASSDFPLYDIIEVANDALKNLGDIPLVNTSLTTAANQTEYTIPIALKGRELLGIEIQGTTNDSDDNQYWELPNWKVVPATAGTAETLVIPQLSAGYTIRLKYLGKHPRVNSYDDPISEHFHPELVHAAVWAHVLEWRNDASLISGGADQSLLALEQKAWSQYDRARYEHPVEVSPRRIQGHPAWGAGNAEHKFREIPTS